jgi:hypothetical protein
MQVAERRIQVADIPGNMGAHHRPARQEAWEQPHQRRIAGAGDVAVQHPVGRSPAGPPVQVHHQEGNVVGQVDRRHRLVELERVERHRLAAP